MWTWDAACTRPKPCSVLRWTSARQLLRDALGLDLRTILYPPPDSREEADRRLSQTGFTQPALFVIEYALAKLWDSWGIRPAKPCSGTAWESLPRLVWRVS